MNTPNFVLLNNFAVVNGEITQFAGRHVAFPVATAKDGKTVFATCAHALEGNGSTYAFQFLYSDGTELPPGDPSTNYIVPKQLGFDLAFMAVHTDRKIDPVRFSVKKPIRPTRLRHSRNVCHSVGFTDDDTHIISEHDSVTTGQRFCWFNGQFEEVEDVCQLTGVMPKVTHLGLSMQSWPGVSGSPLWDEKGRVIGMVAGGNSKLTAYRPNYFLCYLPAKQIQGCIDKFLKGSVI